MPKYESAKARDVWGEIMKLERFFGAQTLDAMAALRRTADLAASEIEARDRVAEEVRRYG